MLATLKLKVIRPFCLFYFESCVWRTVSSHASHHPQEVLLAQCSLYEHKGVLKPYSFHFIFILMTQHRFPSIDLFCFSPIALSSRRHWHYQQAKEAYFPRMSSPAALERAECWQDADFTVWTDPGSPYGDCLPGKKQRDAGISRKGFLSFINVRW